MSILLLVFSYRIIFSYWEHCCPYNRAYSPKFLEPGWGHVPSGKTSLEVLWGAAIKNTRKDDVSFFAFLLLSDTFSMDLLAGVLKLYWLVRTRVLKEECWSRKARSHDVFWPWSHHTSLGFDLHERQMQSYFWSCVRLIVLIQNYHVYLFNFHNIIHKISQNVHTLHLFTYEMQIRTYAVESVSKASLHHLLAMWLEEAT